MRSNASETMPGDDRRGYTKGTISQPTMEFGYLRRVSMGILVTAIYVFLLSPIIIVVFTSFNPTTANTFPPSGFSLRWYGAFFESSGFTSAFQFSLWLGLIAAVAATVIGFFTAYGITRFLTKKRELGQSLAMLPVMIPHILISISLLLLLTVLPIPEMTALIVGHTIICLPFTIAGITASLEGVDKQLELAALTLGASRFRVLVEIVIPLIAPGMLSALIFAFIISFGDVYIALFLSGPGMTTLPIEIFSYMQWESTPVIAAITTLQILMIVVLGLVIERLVGLRKIMRV
ncbi:ABC transporter permease [Oceanibacterium hippocampi]|uniref:Putative 2-aminoethylphosphonate transport system permease protein PhnV n=1 Tax=Oceanibacterium hippocampi TaxID=745714 RepID=A0A1Y5TIB4_9PROT|nr:ABC transporter permease [Oceanibacterium hippocampi]SLN64789.1 Putative 2-aminoethylphosphonate transport system permease protein PhnV [Oceanibacterium hippocampi]